MTDGVSLPRLPSPPMLLPAPELHLQQRRMPPGSTELVRRVFQLQAREAGGYFLLPGSGMTLVFLPHSGRSLLCGVMTTLRRLPLAAGELAVCVQLLPGRGDRLAGEAAAGLTDRTEPLESYLPEAGQLMGYLTATGDFSRRSQLLVRVLEGQAAPPYGRTAALVEQCLQRLAESRGQLSIEQLAREAGCSQRYLSRLFHQWVGMSGKKYSQLVQLHCSLPAVLLRPEESLLRIAVACGYFDQAHMNRSYRQFLLCSAGDLRRRVPLQAPDLTI